MINCEVELKLRGTNYCVLSVLTTAAAADNANANSNNIVFTIKETIFFVLAVSSL